MRGPALTVMSAMLAALLFNPAELRAKEADEYGEVEARVHKNGQGLSMPYRVLKPKGYDPKVKYPLVLCLHGAGGRGTDNRSRGTEAFKVLATEAIQKKHPAILVSPQCPGRKQWVDWPWKKGSYSLEKVKVSKPMSVAIEILEKVMKELSVDPDRVYVSGQSMGGFGTWDIVMRKPELFAAAAPMCGAGDPTQAQRIAQVPIWTFHGSADKTVPVSGSREMAEALKKVNGKIKYTEMKAGHLCWAQAWRKYGLVEWLFEQKRAQQQKQTP